MEELECLAANSNGHTAAQPEAKNPWWIATEQKVDCPNDGELGTDAYPEQDDRKGLLPFVGEAACQPLLVSSILAVKQCIS